MTEVQRAILRGTKGDKELRLQQHRALVLQEVVAELEAVVNRCPKSVKVVLRRCVKNLSTVVNSYLEK